MAYNKKDSQTSNQFDSITLGLCSPDDILERSYGEVLKPETINYRSYKPERDGLFCERIFGPVKDYECFCGKYKRIRYKGIVCDRCGVEVTRKKVRRERMGHIKLVIPVVHIWFFKSLPNKLGYLLGLSSKNLESIIYYERYVVIQVGQAADLEVKKMDLLSEEEYYELKDQLPADNDALPNDDPNKFIARMGADGIKMLLESLDLDQLAFALRHQAQFETSQQRKSEALKRLKVVEAFREGNTRVENKPEWTIIQYLPVIPPELRPLVPLDGGRFASSDLNDLYRRVIIRNNRLKRLLEIKAPEVILRNEKRMLQESVDSLFDNSRKSNAVKAEGGRALKSLSDVLKGKQGRFRQNLLGKRVDYSGRSVIVVGPTLQLHECGIPKEMASELFKPFIIRKLIERGIVKTVKSAKKLVDRKEPVIWGILENILKGHPVLLNRAPTLHRLSIQAFQPKLVEGKAIQLHPLVCGGFNADFDGDQMAVHVPLSQASILEAQVLLLASHNLLNPQDGSPITLPSQDMVLGLYYLTKERKSTDDYKVRGEGMTFYSEEEVLIAFNENKIDLQAAIKVRVNIENEEGELENKRIDTTVGRVIFNHSMPDDYPFVNELLTKKALKTIIGELIEKTSFERTAHILDQIKELGFYWAFRGGLSFNLGDLIDPSKKETFLENAQAEVDEVWMNYNMGLITNNERYNQIIDKWTFADNMITDNLMKELANHKNGFNSAYMMLHSGARGSKQQIKQLCGMRGLMAKPRKSGDTGGAIIENPILSNFKDGLSVLDYFISTHGARKGLADTALKTADAGYLTRRLVDVAQDVVINEEDCNSLRGVAISAVMEGDQIVQSLKDRIVGRYIVDEVVNPDTGEVIVASGSYITTALARKIEAAEVDTVKVRSVLTCETKQGVCATCYGKNLATGRRAEIGDAVGIIAAQSIGEPGTQLTLRTFHVGGVASIAKSSSEIIAKHKGTAEFDNIQTTVSENHLGEKINVVLSRSGELKIVDKEEDKVLSTHHIPYGSTLYFADGDEISRGDMICEWDAFNAVIVSQYGGLARFRDIEEHVTYSLERDDQTGNADMVIIEAKRAKKKIPSIEILSEDGEVKRTYNLPVGSYISIDDGQEIKAGQTLAKIPRSLGKISDITGGLPRVTELFEARNPSNPSTVSEIDGVVSYGKIKRGNREVFVTNEVTGQQGKYLIGLSRHFLVQEGDFVRAGTSLSDGAISPVDILDIEGPRAVYNYLLNGVQEVYRSQGITINDKHIEVIIGQMLARVQVLDPGDTNLLENEIIDRGEFLEANTWIWDKKVITSAGDSEEFYPGQIISVRQLREENSFLRRQDKELIEARDAEPSISKPVLQGITRASLGTASWISAASFQETTKVLSTAAIGAKRDDLIGLKENVIVGKQIPAGTGMRKYRDLIVAPKDELEDAVYVDDEEEAAE